jgi:hypothetical protein
MTDAPRPSWLVRNLSSGWNWLAAGWFLALSVAFTWPLALHAGTSVLDQFGDNMQFVWLIGWFQRAVFELHRLPLDVPQLNYPQGWNLARTEITPIQILMGLPFSFLSGPVLGYNLVIMATFFLSGLTAFAWIRQLTGSLWAALIAGTLFGFLPFRVAHVRAGHLNVAGTMWFPLYFMGMFSLLSGERKWRLAAPLTGISLGLVSMTSQYTFYMTVVVTLFVAGSYLVIWDRERLRRPAFWRQVGLAVLWSAPLLVIGEYPFASLAAGNKLPNRSIADVVNGSASLTDFFLPSTDHFLLGQWIGDTFARDHWIEGSLYMGAVGFPLAIVGAIRGLKSAALKRTTLLFLLLFVVAGVLTLGTHLFWNESMVHVAIPGPLQGLLGRTVTSIPLPGYVLFKVFPFYAKMRTFKRTGILALLAVCGLAGLGANGLMKDRSPGVRRALGVGLLLLVVLDFYPGPFRLARVEPRPVDVWLASRPDNGAVAIFPFDLEEDQIQVYYSLINGKPFLGGFFNAYPPGQYLRIRPIMEGFPDEASVAALRTLGVRYVIIDEPHYPDPGAIEGALDARGLISVGQFGVQRLYILGDGG